MTDLRKISIEDLRKEIQNREKKEEALKIKNEKLKINQVTQIIKSSWENIKNVINLFIDSGYYCYDFNYSNEELLDDYRSNGTISKTELNGMNSELLSHFSKKNQYNTYLRRGEYSIRLYKMAKKHHNDINLNMLEFLEFYVSFDRGPLDNCVNLTVTFGEQLDADCGHDEISILEIGSENLLDEKTILKQIYKEMMSNMERYIAFSNSSSSAIANIAKKLNPSGEIK